MDDRTIVNELQNGSSQSSLACKSCRRKKLKCDRSLPQCRSCQKASRSCEYPSVAQKPGPRPGTHRRTFHTTSRRDVEKGHSVTLSDSQIQSHDTPNWSENGTTLHGSPSDKHKIGSLINHDSQYSQNGGPNNGSSFSHACQLLGTSEQACWKMIDVYLANMTAFSLFHQPTFRNRLWSIKSSKHIQVLLASMFVYSLRFTKNENTTVSQDLPPESILGSAYTLGQECLIECADETPPLHLLQALVLQAHLFSTFGVRGKAWRLVGQCVRTAYELRLHELDLDLQDREMSAEESLPAESEHWILTEEKRRVWWAIWECDVFASTIQRLPNAIDWTRNRTNLPSTDEEWFNGDPARSCRLHVDPNRRWRDLRDSGNQSPTAWFLLINSYKWEALSATQRIAPPTTYFEQEVLIQGSTQPKDFKAIFARKRELIENCVRCALGALPPCLQLDTNSLTFEPSAGPHPSNNLIRDHFRYMIHIMSQITQLLISRKDLEGGNYIAYPADLTQPASTAGSQAFHVPTTGHTERKRWQRCLQTSEKMAAIVRAASPSHHQYVNPNAATALWMAAATQLAAMAYHSDEIDLELAQSNLDLLTTTIEGFIAFWDVPTTLIQSLATLETQLRTLSRGAVQGSGLGDTAVAVAAVAVPTTSHMDNVNPANMSGLEQKHHQLPHPNGTSDIPDLTNAEMNLELSPFDILQAMDFGAMYNGVENWENLFLDPGFPVTDLGY